MKEEKRETDSFVSARVRNGGVAIERDDELEERLHFCQAVHRAANTTQSV